MAKSALSGCLTEAELIAACGRVYKRAVSPEKFAILKAVLVDGQERIQVAREFKKAAQYVNKECKSILDDTVIASQLKGWDTITVTVPPELAQKILKMEQEARDNAIHSPEAEATKNQLHMRATSRFIAHPKSD